MEAPLIKPDIRAGMENEGITFRGNRGECPFCSGTSKGTLAIYCEKQQWHCFRCNDGGNLISFIMKLHDVSFKDALKYLNIIPGKLQPIDPTKEYRKNIQRHYKKNISALYELLCQKSRDLHHLRLKVKENPGALTDVGAVHFAELMAELAPIDYKIDRILFGSAEDHFELLGNRI